jgi:hypothetical protein
MAASSLLLGLMLLTGAVLRRLCRGPKSPPPLEGPGVEPRVWAVSVASPLAPVSSLPPLLPAPIAAGPVSHIVANTIQQGSLDATVTTKALHPSSSMQHNRAMQGTLSRGTTALSCFG